MVTFRVSALRIRNFGRITSAEYAVGPSGLAFAGRNATGKGNTMSAIEMALQRIGVADAIKHIRYNAESGKTEVDLELLGSDGARFRVARSITEKGAADPRIKVLEGQVAFGPGGAREQLEALIGRPALDPLAFYLADEAKQRKLLIEALPVAVTREELSKWAAVPADFVVVGNGLEVVARLREVHHSARKDANAKAKNAREDAKRAASDAQAAAQAVPVGALPLAEAVAKREEARRVVAVLDAQAEAAARAATKTASTRQRVADLKAQAERLRAEATTKAPDDDAAAALAAESAAATARSEEAAKAFQAAGEALRVAQAAYDQARRDHAAALQAEGEARDRVKALDGARVVAERLNATAASAETQAKALETAIADMGATAPAQADREAAVFAAAQADAAVQASEKAKAAALALDRAAQMSSAACDLEHAAEVLDGHVKALTNDAPAALLAKCLGKNDGEADFLSGISIESDRILVTNNEGARVRLDVLSGAERMRLSVDLAKRLALRSNAGLRVMLVHRLEEVDEQARLEFLSYLVADDWQVFASCVARSDRDILGRALEKAADFRAEQIDALLYEEAAAK